jgi:hypothetical protein
MLLDVLGVDPLFTLPAEPDHFFDQGLVKLLVNVIYKKMPPENIVILQARMDAFELPSNWPAISHFEFTSKKNISLTMSLFRRMLTVCVHIMHGLIPESHHKLLLGLFRIRLVLFQSNQDMANWQKLRVEAQKWVKDALAEFPAFDRWNLHAMMEAILTDGPVWYVKAIVVKQYHKYLLTSFAVWCGVVWCGVVWCGVVWCGVVWCGVVWCVVWCGV